MDEDDVDPNELVALLLDVLGGDLADVRDELQLQVFRLSTACARAHVGHDMLPLDVEGAVHGDGGLGRRSDSVAISRASPTTEEGGVAFDLDQVEVAGGIDHLSEQPGGGCLGVSEAHPMGAHVLGVAADISDQEERRPRLHARKSYWTPLVLDNSGTRGPFPPSAAAAHRVAVSLENRYRVAGVSEIGAERRTSDWPLHCATRARACSRAWCSHTR
jgi:hypothetical protein